MNDTAKSILKLILRLTVTMALLLWVFSNIDTSQLKGCLHHIKWVYVLVAWALILLIQWLRAVKLRILLEEQDCFISTAGVFAATAVTLLYNFVLPGFVSTGVKWYIIKKQTRKGENVLSAMFYNQVSDIVTLTAVALVALMIANPGGDPRLPIVSGIMLAALILVSVLLLSRSFGGKLIAVFQFMLKPFPQVVRKKGGKVLEQIALFQNVSWSFHLYMLWLTLTRTVVLGALYVFAAKAANVNIPLGAIVWLFVLVYLLGRLPISIANLGVREVTLVHALAPYGIEPASALLMSMVIFSTLVLMAVIGAFYKIWWTVSPDKPATSQQ